MIVVVFPLLVTVVVETDDVTVEVLDDPFEEVLPSTVTVMVVLPSSETIFLVSLNFLFSIIILTLLS